MRVHCENCQKEFNKPPRRIKNTKLHFCSQECHYNFKNNQHIREVLNQKFFGAWTILEHNGVDNSGFQKFKCECQCGRITNVRGRSLINKKSLCCNKCIHKQNVGSLTGNFFYQIKIGGAIRNIKFMLTKNYLWELFLKQNSKCYYTQTDLFISDNYKDHKSGKTTASLDRINSSKGYVEGNVVWCHKDINMMKKDLEIENFIYYCNQVANFDQRFPKFDRVIINNTHNSFKGYKEITLWYFNLLKSGANKRNLSFTITIEDIWDLYILQGGICALSGLEIIFCPFSKGTKKRFNQTASVDRIDSTKGYIIDNIQIVHKDVNFMKQKLSDQHFKELCILVRDEYINKL